MFFFFVEILSLVFMWLILSVVHIQQLTTVYSYPKIFLILFSLTLPVILVLKPSFLLESSLGFFLVLLFPPGSTCRIGILSSNFPDLQVYSHGQNIWEKLQFSCEIANYGKSSISIFKNSLASIDKIFLLGGRLGTRL